jgi:hypothetical protein
MKLPTIDERFSEFLDRPTRARWRAVRESLLDHSEFDPYAPAWRSLEDQFAAESYSQLWEECERLGQLGCLSPRFHFLKGIAAEEIGQSLRTVARQKRAARLCMKALLNSGQGTVAKPYVSTYCWDCYDVLQALGVESSGQQLVQVGGRWCDALRGSDGREFWFDVTDLIERRAVETGSKTYDAAGFATGRPF